MEITTSRKDFFEDKLFSNWTKETRESFYGFDAFYIY